MKNSCSRAVPLKEKKQLRAGRYRAMKYSVITLFLGRDAGKSRRRSIAGQIRQYHKAPTAKYLALARPHPLRKRPLWASSDGTRTGSAGKRRKPTAATSYLNEAFIRCKICSTRFTARMHRCPRWKSRSRWRLRWPCGCSLDWSASVPPAIKCFADQGVCRGWPASGRHDRSGALPWIRFVADACMSESKSTVEVRAAPKMG